MRSINISISKILVFGDMLRWAVVVGARQTAASGAAALDERFAQECSATEVSWPTGADRMQPATAAPVR